MISPLHQLRQQALACLLGSAAVCFFLQLLTGLLLSLNYEPSLRPAQTLAGKSIVALEITKNFRDKTTQNRFNAGEIVFAEFDTATKAPFYAPDTLRTLSRIITDTASQQPLQPTIAYFSVEQAIMRSSDFGGLVRGMHRAAASVGIVALTLWMLLYLLPFFPHETLIKPHIAGTLLFALVFGTSLLGYILPMNLQSRAALDIVLATVESFPLLGTVLTKLLKGASALSSTTLVRVYILHILVVPLLIGACWFLLKHTLWERTKSIQSLMMSVGVVWLCTMIACSTALPSQDIMRLPADLTKVMSMGGMAQPEWYALGFAALLNVFPAWGVSVGAVLWFTLVFIIPLLERFPAFVGNSTKALSAALLLMFCVLTVWELRAWRFPRFGFTDESLEVALVVSILSAAFIGAAWAYCRQSEK
ncbi:MAG: cytochrome b N-terminal domain-containing protein [Candidatus Kapabacteria bacterium]|jgi:quinol-cytochrome oxidoreductase complex cytochrome b subunit|nr:cytochrome b N-terminal domain-containing protein [Candidatus Kapabacteria bacterium]